jgi:3-oxoacyl-[acyl-carrier protein] reductase
MSEGKAAPQGRKVAIVTGSAAGIGAATALRLAQNGVNVVVNYSKSRDEAEAVGAECRAAGADVLVHRADVASDEDCRGMVAAAVERWGRLDYLVNNAGATKFVEHGNLDGLSGEDFQRIYAVNVVGAFQMIRAAAPAMREAGKGAVVNVSSIAGTLGIGSSIAYAASKAALINLTISLARALGPAIRVNVVCPGFVGTRWLQQGLAERYAETEAMVAATTPLKVASQPEDIAEPVTWLLQNAAHVTGEVLQVDAGIHLMMGTRPPKK